MNIKNEGLKSKRERNGRILMALGVLLVIIAPIIFANVGLTHATKETGPIGDTIGGITSPIVGLLGAILVYYALLEQIEANRLINEQFKEQKKITHRQNFEQSFFNMLNIHHEIVSNISLVPSDLDDVLFFIESERKAIEKDISDKISLEILERQANSDGNEKSYVHREFFKFSLDTLKELIYLADKYGGLEESDKTRFVNPHTNKSFYSYFPRIYSEVFHRLDTHLGHYYRNLYRIIKMIDEQKFSEDEKEDYETKYFYTSIVRSQLSDYEIQWLFFNGLFDYGDKFKPLIQEYSLLKILLWNSDKTIVKFKPLYKETAFKKVLWEEKTDKKTGVRKFKRKEGYERTGFL